MFRNLLICLVIFFCSCKPTQRLVLPTYTPNAANGKAFFTKLINQPAAERELLILHEIESGNIPEFLKKLVPIRTSFYDSVSHQSFHILYFVTADYLSIGNNKNFARIPMTPKTAQKIADSLFCFLPTVKMVNDIYKQAKVKVAPQPLTQNRESPETFYQHHLLIEKQRNKKHGLIAGIKKDIVLSDAITKNTKPNRMALYGWHQLNGIPIQPLYTGHVNHYVDYSHGIRLIYRTIFINGKKYDYTDVLKDPLLRKTLTEEEDCSFTRYKVEDAQ